MNDSKAKTPRIQGSAFGWGSDIIADALREQQFPYVALVPGASFRGLHDSIVNYLGNNTPKMLVCLHEEHSVAIAHGWAQVTNEPIAAILHTNVGLMHATMTIFNAWCDRMPVTILGAGGPMDAEKRRPWIEWIHTAADQGALVRDYTKWDDQPGSAAAAVDSIRRGTLMTRTHPQGPVYINLDMTIQEEKAEEKPAFFDIRQYGPPADTRPDPADIERSLDILGGAESPVFLIGRVSRSEQGWADRVALAEQFGAKVYTAYNAGGSFPKTHDLHRAVSQFTIRGGTIVDDLRGADAVLSLDWTDLGGTVDQIFDRGADLPPIINCSNDFHVHRGWSMDYHRLQPATVRIATTTEAFSAALLEKLGADRPEPAFSFENRGKELWEHEAPESGDISIRDLAKIFNDVTAAENITMVSRPIGWPNEAIPIEHPLDFLGSKGGEGIGAGPGIGVGAALAVRDKFPERLAATILGDGDYLMGATALWTAASEEVPLLVVIANNRSYFNDEVHQERVAIARDRPRENKWIGQRIDEPAPDLSGIARNLGCEGAGPVAEISELAPAIEEAMKRVKAGACYVLDVVVRGGYASPAA